MKMPSTPEQWAFQMTHLMNAVLGVVRYPLDIAMIAQDYSHQVFPDDPILKIAGGDLPTFVTIASRGRINCR